MKKSDRGIDLLESFMSTILAKAHGVNPYIILYEFFRLGDIKNIQINKRGIRDPIFIKKCLKLQEKHGFTINSTQDFIEKLLNVKFCHLRMKNNGGQNNSIKSFYDQPEVGLNVIYVHQRPDRLNNKYFVKIEKSQILDNLRKSSKYRLLKCGNFDDLKNFLGLKTCFKFNFSNFSKIEGDVRKNIVVFDIKANILHNPVRKKFEETLNIALENVPDFNNEIKDFYYIPKIENFLREQKSKINVCKKTLGCSYSTDRAPNLERHVQICTSEQKIFIKQREYGSNKNLLHELISLGYLSERIFDFRKNFWCTYDIETFESGQENILKILSISAATTSGRVECFVRETDDHDSVVIMIEKFVNFLENALDEFDQSLPDYLKNALAKLSEDKDAEGISIFEKRKLAGLYSQLKSYCSMSVYGFNSGKMFVNRFN